MKQKNQKALHDFLSHADSVSDDILADTKEMLGSIPYILPVLRERPEYFALSSLADEMVCRPQHLSPKTAELVAPALREFCEVYPHEVPDQQAPP